MPGFLVKYADKLSLLCTDGFRTRALAESLTRTSGSRRLRVMTRPSCEFFKRRAASLSELGMALGAALSMAAATFFLAVQPAQARVTRIVIDSTSALTGQVVP